MAESTCGNWVTSQGWSQGETHERHCVATGYCDWRDPVWAYVRGGPPIAPRPGPKDHVFIYAPQCVDMRTLPPNETFRELSVYGSWPVAEWSVSYPFPWRVWHALRTAFEYPFLRLGEQWWRLRMRWELWKEERNA